VIRTVRKYCLIILTFCSIGASYAQENIPLGEWRIHVSYQNIRSISAGDESVFAAAQNGIVAVDKADKSYKTYHKLNLLSKAGIEVVAYDDPSATLLVCYEDGTFDAVKAEQDSRNFDPSANTVLTGSKRIHQITFQNSLAYLSADYGVLVFDLQKNDIKETWRDLGTSGTTIQIYGSTFFNDSIFLATEKGVMAGDLQDNLLDFNKWKRFDEGEFAGAVDFITNYNNTVYAGVSGSGIFVYQNNTWIRKDYLPGVLITSMSSSGGFLWVVENNKIWRISETDIPEQIEDPLFPTPTSVLADGDELWIGDATNGLVTNHQGAFESIIPNGPAFDQVHDISFFGEKMYFVPGGFTGGVPRLNPGVVSAFANGVWNYSKEDITDLTSVTFSPAGEMFLSSFGFGVLNKTANTLFDETNSTLINSNPPGRNVKVSALHYATDGLWAANYGTTTSLHRLSPENQWEAFTIPFSSATAPLKLLTDYEGNVWMQLNPGSGGGIVVFNPFDAESRLLTELDENGELPSNSVYSIALDRDGYVWAGTDAGVAYFYDDGSDAVKPIFENRFLLRDDKVTAIAVDGGNRKWMGTERGVWLFNPTGEAAIANFTAANSPLLSDIIIDIEINPVTGEVFFATDKGLISFRSDATESRVVFDDVKIFPNPVAENYTGEVGISGLATDAVVKITDVSGKLIYETVANGGTASWDVRDHHGRRVPTGVFLVFAVKSDGSESVVGKIAVIN
jgi:hypothetical protein